MRRLDIALLLLPLLPLAACSDPGADPSPVAEPALVEAISGTLAEQAGAGISATFYNPSAEGVHTVASGTVGPEGSFTLDLSGPVAARHLADSADALQCTDGIPSFGTAMLYGLNVERDGGDPGVAVLVPPGTSEATVQPERQIVFVYSDRAVEFEASCEIAASGDGLRTAAGAGTLLRYDLVLVAGWNAVLLEQAAGSASSAAQLLYLSSLIPPEYLWLLLSLR